MEVKFKVKFELPKLQLILLSCFTYGMENYDLRWSALQQALQTDRRHSRDRSPMVRRPRQRRLLELDLDERGLCAVRSVLDTS